MLQYGAVGLFIYKRQPGAATPDVVAIRGAVTIVPMPVFVEHGILNAAELALADLGGLAKEILVDALREQLVAFAGEVNAVDRQRLFAALVQLLRQCEQINKLDALLVGYLARGLGVLGQALVVG